MSFFKKIGQFFKNLFNAVAKAYNKLSPEEKASLQYGSGIVDILNTHLEDAPATIRQLIQVKFPELDVVKLEEAVFTIAKQYNLTNISNFDEGIKAIQEYLKSQEGKEWAQASRGIALIISAVFAPSQTKLEVLASIIGWVYHTFFKKNV